MLSDLTSVETLRPRVSEQHAQSHTAMSKQYSKHRDPPATYSPPLLWLFAKTPCPLTARGRGKAAKEPRGLTVGPEAQGQHERDVLPHPVPEWFRQ